MTRFNWNFDGHPAVFSSTEESHEADIFKAAKMLGIAPETKLTKHDFTNDRRATTDTVRIDSDSTNGGKSTVHEYLEEAQTGILPLHMSHLYGDVDPDDTTDPTLESDQELGSESDSDDHSDFAGDSVADDAN